MTKNSRYMGDSDVGRRVTSNREIGERVLARRGTDSRYIGERMLARRWAVSQYIGDCEPGAETLHIWDMGDGAASTGAHALENDVSNG